MRARFYMKHREVQELTCCTYSGTSSTLWKYDPFSENRENMLWKPPDCSSSGATSAMSRFFCQDGAGQDGTGWDGTEGSSPAAELRSVDLFNFVYLTGAVTKARRAQSADAQAEDQAASNSARPLNVWFLEVGFRFK